MNSTDVVTKTAAGVEELKSKSRKLMPRLRTMLIMIDGSLTVEQLQQAAAKLAVPADFVQSLELQGLIAVVPSETRDTPAPVREKNLLEVDRFRAAQKFMNDSVVDALGFRAFFFTLKLEKCFTRADLLELIPDYVKAITKGGGEEVARVLQKRSRELLS